MNRAPGPIMLCVADLFKLNPDDINGYLEAKILQAVPGQEFFLSLQATFYLELYTQISPVVHEYFHKCFIDPDYISFKLRPEGDQLKFNGLNFYRKEATNARSRRISINSDKRPDRKES
jgi:hypothetical protein